MAGGQGAASEGLAVPSRQLPPHVCMGQAKVPDKKILVYGSPHTAEPELESENARCTLDSKQTVGVGF